MTRQERACAESAPAGCCSSLDAPLPSVAAAAATGNGYVDEALEAENGQLREQIAALQERLLSAEAQNVAIERSIREEVALEMKEHLEATEVETEQRFLDGGMKRIDDSVRKLAAKAVSKGKLTQEQADANVAGALGRITPTLDRGAFASCDLLSVSPRAFL